MVRLSRLFLLACLPALFAIAAMVQNAPLRAAGTFHEPVSKTAMTSEGRNITVIDGDTIIFDGTVYDIAGIDAPELGQQCRHDDNLADCGMSSAMQLRKYFAMAPFPVHCWLGNQELAQKDDHFPVVECAIAERDIAAAMITDGEALPVAGYSHQYDRLSVEADNAGIGLHGMDMIAPADWRNGKRLSGEAEHCLFVETPDRHYIGSLDPRFANQDAGKDAKICSDEEARAKGLTYLPLMP